MEQDYGTGIPVEEDHETGISMEKDHRTGIPMEQDHRTGLPMEQEFPWSRTPGDVPASQGAGMEPPLPKGPSRCRCP